MMFSFFAGTTFVCLMLIVSLLWSINYTEILMNCVTVVLCNQSTCLSASLTQFLVQFISSAWHKIKIVVYNFRMATQIVWKLRNCVRGTVKKFHLSYLNLRFCSIYEKRSKAIFLSRTPTQHTLPLLWNKAYVFTNIYPPFHRNRIRASLPATLHVIRAKQIADYQPNVGKIYCNLPTCNKINTVLLHKILNKCRLSVQREGNVLRPAGL
jgi:hypothetical protein